MVQRNEWIIYVTILGGKVSKWNKTRKKKVKDVLIGCSKVIGFREKILWEKKKVTNNFDSFVYF